MTYQMLASFSRYVLIYAYVSLNRIYGFHGYQLSNKESVPQYLEYEPWVDNPNLGEASLQFEFKTNVANGVLMTVSDGDKGMHKLRLSLNDGKLHVYLMMGESDQLRKKEISVGKQWNDMKWHSVKLTRRFRFVTLSIDNMEETISSDGESPDRLIVDSNLFIGLDPDQSNLIEGFTGCIINISYPIGTQPKPPQFVRGDVKDECDDECTDSENECLNGGKCIKKLDNSKSVCDCGGTGMKGKFCSEPELVAYFDGNTFVSFPTQPLENFRNNRIQFRFRTNEPFGIIAFGGNTHRHVVIELYRGNIQANISLGADNVVVSAGNNALHDGEWHSVIIERSGTEIVLSVDRESYPESYVDEKHFKYQPPSRCTEDVEERLNLMVGGHPYANTLAISTSKKNYQGCLQQVLFDSHNSEIIKLAKYPNIYRIIEGQIRFSCPVTPQKVKKFEKSDISTFVNRNTQTQLQTKSKSRLSQNTVAWITGGICVGSIALILTLACGFNKIRKKYSGQFLAQKSGKFLHTREALEKINGRVAKEFYLISSRDTSPRIFESPFRRDGHGAVV